jgi:pyruvate/2-oxoglutarate dehydrogenase complex dihydrolipoamide acyltransferase (E2) component
MNATEAAVALAAEHGLDLADVVGSGADGRILKSDVEAHLAELLTAKDAEGAKVGEATPPTDAEILDAMLDEPEAVAEVRAQTELETAVPKELSFADQVQAAETIQALIALGGQAAGEAERAAVRERAKELLNK